MKRNRVWPQVLCITVGIALASWALVMDRAGLAQPTPEGKKQQAQPGTIEDAKKKGFEGVDFSYDVFGAPPGQDPQKSFRPGHEEGCRREIGRDEAPAPAS